MEQAAERTRTYSMYALVGVSLAHLFNDAMQTVIPAGFPLFQQQMNLSFSQIGWVAFVLNVTASLLQPLIGYYTDKRPMPAMLPAGMIFSLAGMIGLASSANMTALLLSVMAVGIGSSVLHPESSRVAHLAAGKGRGLAQSVFQVGGNTGQALGPLLVALLLVPKGQQGFVWLSLLALAGIAIQIGVSRWYKSGIAIDRVGHKEKTVRQPAKLSGQADRKTTVFVIGVLILLLFSKFVYLAGMNGFYSFYYMNRYGLPLANAQLCLFVLQFAGMLGTLLGGPLADRIGRKSVIWFSIFGTAPFAMLLPYAGPTASLLLCVPIGLILMSGFSVIIVYAQEMLPGKVGTVAGLFFGLSFGMGGIGSVALGWLADATSVTLVIRLCAFLPLLGIVAFLLPKDRRG
ncbi:Fosmidomycin resistance protein [Gordoniibacillus kamchatkensis]|uniref:Fosmidomycin resistance protein n=1 Tax=Gordoniibacillus kamchatkensis TaxID=1590651 RepID=A0ABR5AFH8_9BACL|nr:MFS transporter [Paenibacillus sp. VKM B-2647]KIL39811.1 Fosmidomycin resistance protein [Paenibacillus sp. VKM B-2647]